MTFSTIVQPPIKTCKFYPDPTVQPAKPTSSLFGRISPEGKSVENLVFGVYKNALRLREVHMIDRTVVITFLDRRNSESS